MSRKGPQIDAAWLAAKGDGAKVYAPSKPCRRGHSLRLTSNGACVECARVWRQSNPDYGAAYLSDPVKRERHNVRHRGWKLQRLEAIAGRPKPDACEVCGNGGKISFDHCHGTGAFRGWLCDPCNLTLGLVKDDHEVLRKLAGYLHTPPFEAGVSMGLVQ